MNKRRIGQTYEKVAADHLKSQQYLILEHNYNCRAGEVDLVCKDGPYLVFVEVKYRKSSRLGEAAYAVTPQKQARIRRVAAVYLVHHRLRWDTPVRYDVVAIDKDRIRLIRDAF